jgi:hypothetical protein
MPKVMNIDVTHAQAETLAVLASVVEIKEIAKDDMDEGAVVFDGDGVDGPALGYVETDGACTWIVGG